MVHWREERRGRPSKGEIEGVRDADKVSGLQTSAERCKAFEALAKSTKSPSMVLALAGHGLVTPGMPDEQRMDIQRGLAELMFRRDSSQPLRAQLSSWLGILRVPRSLRLAFGQLMLSKCIAALDEFSREPGKDSKFEFPRPRQTSRCSFGKNSCGRPPDTATPSSTRSRATKTRGPHNGKEDRVRFLAVLRAIDTIEGETHDNP